MPIGMLFRFGCSGLFIEVLSPIHLFQFAKSYRVSSTKTKKGQKRETESALSYMRFCYKVV